MGISGIRQCPECGAPVSLRSCDDLFQELLALDHSRQAPWGPLHGIVVACFFLQHPSRRPAAARPFYWALLHAYLRDGPAAAAPITERIRKLNSHRRGGRAPRPGIIPALRICRTPSRRVITPRPLPRSRPAAASRRRGTKSESAAGQRTRPAPGRQQSPRRRRRREGSTRNAA